MLLITLSVTFDEKVVSGPSALHELIDREITQTTRRFAVLSWPMSRAISLMSKTTYQVRQFMTHKRSIDDHDQSM